MAQDRQRGHAAIADAASLISQEEKGTLTGSFR